MHCKMFNKNCLRVFDYSVGPGRVMTYEFAPARYVEAIPIGYLIGYGKMLSQSYLVLHKFSAFDDTMKISKQFQNVCKV